MWLSIICKNHFWYGYCYKNESNCSIFLFKKGCSDLEFVSLLDTLNFVGCNFFFYCEKLKYVTIPRNVKCIQCGTFYQCLSPEWISIPDNIIHVQDHCFEGCSSLKRITVPESYINSTAYHVWRRYFCKVWKLNEYKFYEFYCDQYWRNLFCRIQTSENSCIWQKIYAGR